MRKVLVIALFALIFLAGLALLLYPTVSDHISSRRHVQTVDQYFEAVGNLSERDHTGLLEAARAYNEELLRKPNRFVMTGDEDAEYRSLLDPFGSGVIGSSATHVCEAVFAVPTVALWREK